MISKKELLDALSEIQQKGYRVHQWNELMSWANSLPDDQPKGEAIYPGSYYQPLFNHMSHQHGLTLLQDEMDEIIRVVKEMIDDQPDLLPFQLPIPDGMEVVTRDLRKVEQLVRFDGNGFAGIINGFDGVYTWREDGRDFGQDIREFDLFLRRVEKKVWVVEWDNGYTAHSKYPSFGEHNGIKAIYEAILKLIYQQSIK